MRNITENNINTIIRSIESVLGNELRALDILKNRVSIYKSFLTLNPLKPILNYDKNIFVDTLRMDPLIPNLSIENLESLERISSIEIKRPRDLREYILSGMDKFNNNTKAITMSRVQVLFTSKHS